MTITVLAMVPGKFWVLMSKLGLLAFNKEATEHFNQLTVDALLNRDKGDSSRKDFIQLCKDRLIEDPKPGDPDTLVDDKNFLWSSKGRSLSK